MNSQIDNIEKEIHGTSLPFAVEDSWSVLKYRKKEKTKDKKLQKMVYIHPECPSSLLSITNRKEKLHKMRLKSLQRLSLQTEKEKEINKTTRHKRVNEIFLRFEEKTRKGMDGQRDGEIEKRYAKKKINEDQPLTGRQVHRGDVMSPEILQ